MLKDGYIYYLTGDGSRWRVKYDSRLLPDLPTMGVDVNKLRLLDGWLKRPLYDYQLEAVAHFQRKGGFVLADEMGLGKTLSAIACMIASKSSKTLVVCPANVKYQWEREINKSVTKPLNIVVCEGKSPTERDGTYLRYADVVIINFQIIDDWKLHLTRFNWGLMVIDEAQKIKKSKSICTKAVKAIRDCVEHVICLTGTPLTDRNSDVWNVVSIADNKLFPSEFRFQQRYCTGIGGFGKIGGSINTGELHNTLVDSGVMLRRRKIDVYKELPQVIHTVIPLDVTSKEIRTMESDAFKAMRQIHAAHGSEVSRGIMQLRACIEKYRQETVKRKMPHILSWIEDFLEDSDQKLMVAVVHRDACGRIIHAHFKNKSVLIDGGLTAKQKDEAKERFINDPSCRLLVGNILSTGTGTDGLQTVCSNLLYAELDWSPANMAQCTARLDRNGQKQPVNVTYLTAKDSIEEYLAKTLDKKAEILANVIDGRTLGSEELLVTMMKEYEENGGKS